MARNNKSLVGSPLIAAIATTTLIAACSLDFDGFTYPDEIITSSTGSGSTTGAGGTGGMLFNNSSSATGMGGAVSTGGNGGQGGEAGMGGDGGTAGMGGMGGCSDPTGCPDGAECEQATCDNNMCGLENAPLGDASMQGGNICDGMGACISCQTEPTLAPGGPACPAECGSCADTNNDNMLDQCTMDCTGGNCPANLNCPSTFSCIVECTGNNCSGVTISCPRGQDCTVNCSGQMGNTAACAGATIICDQSLTCNLNCTNQGCNNSSTMVCGNGKCTGMCDNMANGTLVCGNSCWCDVDSDCIQQ